MRQILELAVRILVRRHPVKNDLSNLLKLHSRSDRSVRRQVSCRARGAIKALRDVNATLKAAQRVTFWIEKCTEATSTSSTITTPFPWSKSNISSLVLLNESAEQLSVIFGCGTTPHDHVVELLCHVQVVTGCLFGT